MSEKKGVRLSRFATDSIREIEGVWQDVGGGLRLRIARINNPRYEEEVKRLGKPFGPQASLGFDDSLVEDLTRKAVAKCILLGWENLLDDKDEPVAYSYENSLKVLTEYRELYRLVLSLSSNIELFRTAAKDEAVKN